jgi:polysaccharide export outer membrane protein
VADLPHAPRLPSAYRIQAYDELNVNVWNQPNLSSTVQVRPDLKITLPLVGDLTVGGLTPTGATRLIERRLQGLVVDPKVAVVVNTVRPPMYSVVGEVMTPGSFELRPGQGVLNAVAMAGGLTEYSNREALYVIRRMPEVTRIRFSYRNLVKGIGKGSLFQLVDGDVVVVE